MEYEKLRLTPHDTQAQIDHCLHCKRPTCTNCISQLRVGQAPDRDPCLTCYSRERCRSGSCKSKTQFEIMVKANPSILDGLWVTDDYAGTRVKRGMMVYVAAPGGPVEREVLKTNKTSFRTVDDLYYFHEHRILWWFSESGAKRTRQERRRSGQESV